MMMASSRRSIHRALRGLVGTVSTAGILVGCQDAEGDPVALLLPEDVGGVLALGAELPSLPDLAARAGVTPEMRRAVDLWEASWTADPAEGPGLRSEAYRSAAPELARVLGPTEATRMSTALEAAVAAISSVGSISSDPRISTEVRRARQLRGRVDRALEDGDIATALVHGMEASDALRRFSPSQAVEAYLAKARTALAVAGDSLSEADRDRATRLLEGAESAVAQRDWPRAVQRAYYASQLLAR